MLLMAPCGAGKSLVYEVTIDMIRQESPNKVLVLCLPVNKIMEEKSETNRLPTAYVTMSGRVVVDCVEGEMDSDVSVTEELLEAILRGDSFRIRVTGGTTWQHKFLYLLSRVLHCYLQEVLIKMDSTLLK